MPTIRKFIIENAAGKQIKSMAKPHDLRAWFNRNKATLPAGKYYLRRKQLELQFTKKTLSNSNWKDQELIVSPPTKSKKS